MTTYGYARVSSIEQNCAIQEDALLAAGCELVRSEKRTGTSRADRSELETLLAFLRPGDTLCVTRVDRLARSVGDLQDIVRELQGKGVRLKATEQPIDTSTPAGTAFLNMLAVFAEFETAIRRERQLEGIARAKSNGVYQGRKRSIDPGRIAQLMAEGRTPTEVAKSLGIGRASVYRLIDKDRPPLGA